MSKRHTMAKRFSNYVDYIQSRNQKTRVLYLLSAFSILLFLTIAITLPFKDQVLNRLYPKEQQFAAVLPNLPSAIHGVADFHADSFDSGNTDKWTTNTVDNGNTLQVSEVAAAPEGGSHGLLVKTNTNDRAFLTKTIPDTKEVYTRVKLKVIQKTYKKYIQNLMQLKNSEGVRIFSFGIRNDTETSPLNFNITTGGTNANRDTNLDFNPNQWYCIETYLKIDGSKGHTTVWVDGNQVFNLETNNGEIPVAHIDLGTQGEDKITEYYYDEFAADNYNRIGCGPISADPGPVRSNPLPSGKLPQGTTQVNMTLSTNVGASCKYDTSANVAYDQMANTFSQTGGTSHSATINNVVPQTKYNYYVKCKDTSGKTNTTDEKISFQVPIEKTISTPLSLSGQVYENDLRATYESISIKARYSGDDNKNNTASFQYRKVGSSTWINGMDMTPDKREFVRGNNKLIANDFKNQFRASILMAEPNTEYEVRVTFNDPDGVDGATQTATIRTKSNTFSSSGNTYYVAPPDASNPASSGSGTSASPWRSLDTATKMLNPGDTLLFKPGIYKERVYLDRSGTENNYITLRPEQPLTIAQMKDSANASKRVVIDASQVVGVPGDRNELCGAGNSDKQKCAFIAMADYIRISGFEIIGGEKALKVGADPATAGVHDIIFENNYIHSMDPNGQAGIINVGDTFGETNDTHDVTIQGNEIISDRISKTGGNIQFNAAPLGGHVVRNNRMIQREPGDGQHGNDCMNGLPNFSSYGGYGRDVDIYNNYCEGATDEGIEIDGFNMNIRVWNNTITRANLGFSITPVYYGPVYVFRNVYYNPQQYWVNSCIGVKSGVGGTGHVYFYHNTFYLSDLGKSVGAIPRCGGISLSSSQGVGTGYSDQTYVEITGGGGTGAKAIVRVKDGIIDGIYVVDGGRGYTSAPTVKIIDPTGAGTGATAFADLNAGSSNGMASNGDAPDAENVVYNNNIIMGYDRSVNQFRTNVGTTLDYNLMSEEENTTRWYGAEQRYIADDVFAKWLDKNYKTYSEFRAGTGQEAHGINAKAQFVNAASGDFRLTNTSPGVNSGKVIAGFNDATSPWPYVGAAPDMGAYESGSTVNPPTNPTATPTPIIVVDPPLTPTPTQGVPTPTPTGGVGGVNPTTKLSFNPVTASKTVGSTQDTNVRVETQNTITNADLAVTFNPQVLEIVSVTPGTFLPGAQEVRETIDNGAGKLFYSVYTDSSNAKSGTGPIATIRFRAKAAGTSTLSFDPATTIVYGVGEGNTLAPNGLSTATYTVSGTTVPTATPTNAPTATPTQAPPTPTNTPTPVPCTLQNATWSTAAAGNGEQVTLRVTTNGSASCIGKQVSFDIHENDSLAEGGLDDNVTTNPSAVTIASSTVTRTWQAEWQNDCGGFCNPNEFYFNAQIVGQSGSSVRSAEPYLTISETATPVYTLQVQLNKNVTVSSIPNAEISVTGPEGTITKSITLNKTTTAGIYQGSLPLLVDPGTYTLSIRLPGYLVKKYTISITSTSTAINVSNQPLLAGDVDGNNIVNTLDLGKTIEEYSPEATTTSTADTTFDDKVNALDLGLIIENYFKSGN